MFKNQKSSHFLKRLRIREAPVTVFSKTSKKPQVLSPEGISGFHEKPSGFANGYLILSVLRTVVMYQPPGV
jgi:hypothetical protein